ncbi:hypothetical protein BD408DRAFT_428172 [Parasitella parasitica]|nr:hypothetical protein BD408DRAFT_428172 [Parasitella parasitica]
MENCLQNSSIDTLKEAFPTIDLSIIDDVLYSTQGDLNLAFEMLLDMNSTSTNDSRNRPLSYTPPLPARIRSSNDHFNGGAASATLNINNPQNTSRISQTNPFLADAKPLTVREELAQWRQDLRAESRQKAAANVRSSASTHLSFSNMFKSSNSTRVSLGNDQKNRSNTQATSFQRPLPARPLGSLTGISSSASTPDVNYQSRDSSPPNNSASMLPRAQQSHSLTNVSYRPELPSRRQNNTSDTNPFHENSVSQQSEQQRQQQSYQINSSHRTSSGNDIPSFNPFEEPELPPPAYNDIQRDTIVNLI